MEIRFRAWHTEKNRFVGIDELEEQQDDLVFFNGYTDHKTHGYGLMLESNILEFQLWTGFLDMNGKEVYVGDIINIWEGHINSPAEVVFDDEKGCFCVSGYLGGLETYPIKDFTHKGYEIEVIGNTHEHPELLQMEGFTNGYE